MDGWIYLGISCFKKKYTGLGPQDTQGFVKKIEQCFWKGVLLGLDSVYSLCIDYRRLT